MDESQSIIVYRSRWEKDSDEFWHGVMTDHPFAFLSVLGALSLLILIIACKKG